MKAEELEAALERIKSRFLAHPERHRGVSWEAARGRLDARPEKLFALCAMEETGGEPDMIGIDEASGEYVFADCSPESPNGRRSLCYDEEALAARKEHKPSGSALGMARSMGAELMDEAAYRAMQALGEFDLKTSSWVLTPPDVRGLGGALFMDRRYGRVFVYHNGADSYYAARGFRAILRL
jgi:hypothetical protein